jgi:transposase-like protein
MAIQSQHTAPTQNTQLTDCPDCRADGRAFEVEEGRGVRRITYRCVKCNRTWSLTIPVKHDN